MVVENLGMFLEAKVICFFLFASMEYILYCWFWFQVLKLGLVWCLVFQGSLLQAFFLSWIPDQLPKTDFFVQKIKISFHYLSIFFDFLSHWTQDQIHFPILLFLEFL